MINNNIKISVIIPIYNSEKYIKRCIESIINQSFKDFEIIAVNDGSIDKSYDLLKGIQDNRLQIIDKKNKGVSAARNDGIEISKGEYLLFLDSDDYIEPDFLKNIYEKSIRNKLDILVTDYYWVQDNKKKYMKDLDITEETIISGEEYINQIFIKNLVGYNWNKLIKKELFIKNNIRYNSKIVMMEDTLILIELLKKSSRIGKINRAYYNYIQHDNNTTKKITFKHLKNIEDVFKILKRELNYNKIILKLIKNREIISTWWFFYYLEQEEMDYYIKNIIPKIKRINLREIKIAKIAKIKLYSIKIIGNKKILYFWKIIKKNKW